MKLIATIFPGDQVEVTLVVQSRGGKSDQDSPLLAKYRSKIGNESLIFNPTIALILRGTRVNGPNAPTAWIPVTQIFRYVACLSHVYQSLQSEKLYAFAEGVLYLDKKMASNIARKVPLFRNSLIITPACATDRTGKPTKGVEFTVDGQSIGILEHNEALGLIDLLEHFDVTTYSMLSALVEKLDAIDNKLDYMLTKIEAIETLLKRDEQKGSKGDSPMFKWEVLS